MTAAATKIFSMSFVPSLRQFALCTQRHVLERVALMRRRTNKRMVELKLIPSGRALSIDLSISGIVTPSLAVISRTVFQNSASRLTLVR
jgi:hypothetical protein